MKSSRTLDLSVWVIVILGTLGWWAVEHDDIGKAPNNTVTYAQERDLRTGQVFDIQVIRCSRCGEVLSWVRFDKNGLPIGGYIHPYHDCGKVWGKKQPPDGAAMAGRRFNLGEFLERWQRKLSRFKP